MIYTNNKNGVYKMNENIMKIVRETENNLNMLEDPSYKKVLSELELTRFFVGKYKDFVDSDKTLRVKANEIYREQIMGYREEENRLVEILKASIRKEMDYPFNNNILFAVLWNKAYEYRHSE